MGGNDEKYGIDSHDVAESGGKDGRQFFSLVITIVLPASTLTNLFSFRNSFGGLVLLLLFLPNTFLSHPLSSPLLSPLPVLSCLLFSPLLSTSL